MELFLLGIIGGFVGGLLGIGGGSIYIPALTLIFNVSQPTAQGISLAVMIPMAFLGGWHYLRKKSIDTSIILPLAVTSVFGALLGATLANILPVATLKIIFGSVLLVFSLRMIVR